MFDLPIGSLNAIDSGVPCCSTLAVAPGVDQPCCSTLAVEAGASTGAEETASVQPQAVAPETAEQFDALMAETIADNRRLGEVLLALESTAVAPVVAQSSCSTLAVDVGASTGPEETTSGQQQVVVAEAVRPAVVESVRPEATTSVQQQVAVAEAVRPAVVESVRPEATISVQQQVAVAQPVQPAAAEGVRPEVTASGQQQAVVAEPVEAAVVENVQPEETTSGQQQVVVAEAVEPTEAIGSVQAEVDEMAAVETESDQPQVAVAQPLPPTVVESVQPAETASVRPQGAVAAVTPSVKTVMLEAANAVADALMVSPSIRRGEGEIIVNLKPDVLDGAVVKIEVKGGEMSVNFVSEVPATAALIEAAAPALVERLTEKMPIYTYRVEVQASASTAVSAVTAPSTVQTRRRRDERA